MESPGILKPEKSAYYFFKKLFKKKQAPANLINIPKKRKELANANQISNMNFYIQISAISQWT